MNFESLPNEIILHLFEYLSIAHLFHGFDHLNLRFNHLLCHQFRKFHLDCRLISKTTFNHLCQTYLPSISERIVSLHLSNEDATPQQIELFLSLHIQLRQFTALQVISISSLRSSVTLERIMIECAHLPCLMHLTFTDSHVSMSDTDAARFFNHIWSLAKLTHCRLAICFDYENYFPNPTVVSTSLKHLTIECTCCSSSTLARLCQYTPNLEYLATRFEDDADEIEPLSSILSITRLNIQLSIGLNIFKQLLRSLPNLHHLTVETYNMNLNGYQWEEIITNYLRQLTIFRVKMKYAPSNNEEKESQINHILDSFRTKFWIDEHQWFVRCHWYTSDEQSQPDSIILFTLPYTFDNFYTSTNCILAKSTYPYEHADLVCNYVKNLYYESVYFTNTILSHVRFSNIQYLSLLFPFNEQFFSVISKLDRLTSLYIFTTTTADPDRIELQLQSLLDRTLHLRSLSFGIWSTADRQIPWMNLKSISVRRLDLQGYTLDHDLRCYTDEQCMQLTRSPLGIQCETLLIKVNDCKSVLHLVNNMHNLQGLNVRCEDDHWTDEEASVSPKEDDFVAWLRENLPLTCTIARDTYLQCDVRIWIR